MGLISNLITSEIKEEIAQGLMESLGSRLFSTAFAMCGNNGQRSIIGNQMDESQFVDASLGALDGMDAVDGLLSACPYPEAVEVILSKCGEIMNAMGERLRDWIGAAD